MRMVDEMRHLDAIKGNFMVSESEYIGPLILFEHGKIAPQAVYSNIGEVVEQQQYLFDNFWNQAIPAEERIKEIEEGVIPVRTRLIENQDEIIKQLKHLNDSANKLSICSTFGGMQMSYNYLFDSYNSVVDKHRTGDSKEGMRWIINIDKESLDLVKIFLNAGIQIRHVKNIPPMNFGVSDQEIAVTLEKMEGGKMSQSFLISNEYLYINHFNSLFDELWKNGIDAKDRIEDVEQGNLGDIEVIPNSARAKELYLNLVKSANEEVLLIFPTTSAFIRQHKMGVVQLAKEAAQQSNVKVRMLMPKHESTEPLVRSLKEESHHYRNYDIDVRYYIEQTSGTKATILVVDRKHSLVMELRDDSKTTFDEAIGFSTYSDSRPGVLSYVSIFENIWLQTEMYKKVKETERMQKEFIDIAAHELRNPIQPILGLSQFLLSKTGNIEQYNELLDTISRNATRLNRLTEDILDLTKIESQSLQLHTERFNLREMILNTIADSRNEIKKEYKDKIVLEFVCKNDIFIEADRGRLNQVVSNLLNNAIKFTNKEGIIITTAEKKDTHVVISVKDTGTGIDPEILPRLFTRFATKSETGTGLGLFISKSIVEAHDGRIWAENNSDEKGATFTFSLPLSKEKQRPSPLLPPDPTN